MLLGTAFARHESFRLWEDAWDLWRPSVTKYLPMPQHPSSFGLRLTGLQSQILAMPFFFPGRHFHGLGPRGLAGNCGISGDPVSPNAVGYHYVPGASFEYPAAFGAKAHRPPRLILGHARMLPGLALICTRGMGYADFGGTCGMSGYQDSPNALRRLDAPGASIDNTAPFGRKAHRSPMLPGTAFARQGPGGLRGDLGNLRRPSLIKYRPWLRPTRCFR